MGGTYLIGADIGTTSLKTGLYDERLNCVAFARYEYSTLYPGPGQAEQNPDQWYQAFCLAIGELFDKTTVPRSAIAAVSIDGMSSLALPVDITGRPLMPGLIWLDRRSVEQSKHLQNEYHLLQLSINGNRSDPSNFAPKLMWIRANKPDVYCKAACFLHCNAYLVYKLTGVFSMDSSQSGLSQVCELESGDYSDQLLGAYGIDRDKLPQVYKCTDLVGTITPEAARMSGLMAGTPVIAGAMDNVAATVGMQLQHVGDSYISAGTATNAGLLLDAPVYDGRGLIYSYGVEGLWLLNGAVDGGGAGLHWLKNILGSTSYDQLTQKTLGSDFGQSALVFLPYMIGQRAPLWQEDLGGAFIGITPETEEKHLVQAVMEGLALGIRHVLSRLQQHHAVVDTRTTITGGVTSSRNWVQTIADANNVPLMSCGQYDVAPLGSAILGGIGVGVFPSLKEAFACIPEGQLHSPDSKREEYFNEMYEVFIEMYENLKQPLARLGAIKRRQEH